MLETILAELTTRGQKTGALTFGEVSEALPDAFDPDQLAELIERLESNNITLVEDDDCGETDTPTTPSKAKVADGPGFYPYPAFEALLRRHGIPFEKFGCTMADSSMIHSARLRVTGELALRAWWSLRQLAPETGMWPVIEGHRLGLPNRWLELGDLPATKFVDAIALHQEAWDRIATAKQIPPTPWTFRNWQTRGISLANPEGRDIELPVSEPDTELLLSNDSPFRGIHHRGEESWPIEEFLDIILHPTPIPWQVFAFQPYGGWNDVPWPDEQLAMHRHWHERYGAELVTMNGDWYEMFVPRPPRTRHDALTLLNELTYFGEETIFGYSRGGKSKSKIEIVRTSHYWYFWWG